MAKTFEAKPRKNLFDKEVVLVDGNPVDVVPVRLWKQWQHDGCTGSGFRAGNPA